jgi:hypothetical protein
MTTIEQPFFVALFARGTGPVELVEELGFAPGTVLRAVIQRAVWEAILPAVRADFAPRLKGLKVSPIAWSGDSVCLARGLGRELCLLAWAAEHAQPGELGAICERWRAMPVAARAEMYLRMNQHDCGTANDGQRGWRRALYEVLRDPLGCVGTEASRLRLARAA